MPRPLSAAPLCFRRGSEVPWKPPTLQRVVMMIRDYAHGSCCPGPGTQDVLNEWQPKLLLTVALSKTSRLLSLSLPMWKMVMATPAVQDPVDLQEFKHDSWHIAGPPPMGAVAIIIHEEKESWRE